MQRQIIDVPLPLMRVTTCDWQIDWRSQSAGDGLDGEQIVFSRQPRFVGSPSLVVLPEAILEWRAIITRAQGRRNALRVRMVDPLALNIDGGGNVWRAYQTGQYVEPRPQVVAVGASAAGASSIVVDERAAPHPVRVGSYLSFNDWPFAVTSRSGSGAAVTLGVSRLVTAIPNGSGIDLRARGLFTLTEDGSGHPDYGTTRVAMPQLSLQEWITR
jgi:hypothetical protein